MNRSRFGPLLGFALLGLPQWLAACSAGGSAGDLSVPAMSGASASSPEHPLSGGAGGETAGASGTGQPSAGGTGGAPSDAGSAGRAGMDAGTSGATSEGGGAGSSAASGCAQADILCLTFEADAVGALPQAAQLRPYDCAGQATSMDLLVEAGQGKGGGKALTSKKSLNGGCNLIADLGVHAELWLTADVRFGAGVPVSTVHELTPFELTKSEQDDPGIRPGIRADSSCNSWPGAELNITGGEERTGCTAFQFVTERWYCLEVEVKNQPSSVEADLHIDGVNQDFHIHQDARATVLNPGWTGVGLLRLGARAYSASVGSPIYVDNLSISTKRIGCSAP